MKDNTKNKKRVKKNLVKCSHCGIENLKKSKKCLSCGEDLLGSKSCPRCAKINLKSNKKCMSCGYRFNRIKKANIISLIFCIILIFVLILLLLLGQKEVVEQFLTSSRVVAIGLIVLIIISTLTYGKKDKINYDDYSDMVKDNFIYKKTFSILGVIVGLLIACLVIWITFFTK